MPDLTHPARPQARAHDPRESDDARLRDLEARLLAARARRMPPPRADEHYSRANVAWRMVTELVAGIGIGLGIGLGLDALMGTRPLMLVVFVLLGFAAGVRVMMRTAEEVGAGMEADMEARMEAGAAGAAAVPASQGALRHG